MTTPHSDHHDRDRESGSKFDSLVNLVRDGFENLNAEIREDRAMTTMLKRDVDFLRSNVTEKIDKLETTVLGKGYSDNLIVKIGVLESNIQDLRKLAWSGIIALIAALYAIAQPHIIHTQATLPVPVSIEKAK